MKCIVNFLTSPKTWRIFGEFLLFIMLFMLVIGAWVYFGNWIQLNVDGVEGLKDAETRGLFGDQFGAINALFSGMAFSALICTLLLQRKELSEARSTADHQRFESTFFQLLRLHNENSEKVKIIQKTGIEAFEALNEKLKSRDIDFTGFCALQKLSRPQIRQIKDDKKVTQNDFPELEASDVANIDEALERGVGTLDNFLDEGLPMHEEKVRAAYKKVAEEYIDNFSHYFRNLYHTLKYINDSKLIDSKEKAGYAKFVRSQLSEAELVAIFYNSITKIELSGRNDMELGYPKMAALLHKFDILQNMSPRSIIHPLHLNIFKKNVEEISCK
ncbi:putative phage abortive infection protein [Pseudomonas mangrovi]|uniref:Phage abortive infection protein n=1 Tax=Pseudomonas mangrovi TaxID=2161748 RepID=A0A2T5P501_9PSED|nr:putative phage abortive infection protein [Pseudomonas mangrovi]PTU72805.1 hypothetical protein DBO85_18830 [Pseudomonas mangrovi]